jgi:aminoglycoside phosphotransferase (APT) family kinase protein
VDPHQALVDRLAPGARIERSWPLTGGVSASVVAVAFIRPDGERECVVIRQHRAHDWKPGQPGGVALEHALLERLYALGLPVPRPRLLDASGALVLDHVEGTTAAPADAAAPMAAMLARIHATDLATLPALPLREDPVPALLEWLAAMPALPDALQARGSSRGAATLLHGDFWPGNLVWRDRDIAAVLDWEDAAVGDPLSDLACARVELACAAGEAAARELTECYLRSTARDCALLPVWDLYVSTAALTSMDQWGLPPEVLAHRRMITEDFQRRARDELGVG